MTPTQTKPRSVRKGSLWTPRTWGGSAVRVQFRRGAYVAYTVEGNPNAGGVLPYADFMDRYEWAAAR